MARKSKAGRANKSPSIADMRGVATFDTNEVVVLVRASCHDVSAALQEIRKLGQLLFNARGKTVTLGEHSFVVYQLQGHPWTIVEGYCCAMVEATDAEALSKALSTPTIFYANSDTACITHYELFENGKQLEMFESGDDGLVFKSQSRDIDPPEDGPEIYPFVEEFIRRHDAFLPGWSSLVFEGWRHNAGDEVTLDFAALSDELVQALDFVT